MPTKYPYRDSDDKAIEKGGSVSQARYYHDIQARAEEILEEVTPDEDGNVDSDDIHELISQAADRTVTYTKDAYGALLITTNEDAWEDYGELEDLVSGKTSLNDVITAAAYMAVSRDLTEKVHALAESKEIELNPSTRRRGPKRPCKSCR